MSIYHLHLAVIAIAVHFAIDLQFQSDWIAINKNRHLNKTEVPWYYPMTSHCACHALAVGWLFGFWFGVVEFVLHFFTDVAKCEKLTHIHQDQVIHVLCKLGYVVVLIAGLSTRF